TTATTQSTAENSRESDFIREIVAEDMRRGTYAGRVVTRFPPEPNGFLHIGHAKSICLNFGLAQDFGGVCNLRFDDTNPETEDMRYVQSIQEDIRWLGFDWGPRLYFASDYYEQLYAYGVQLIRDGHAYVDSLSDAEIRAYRGTVTEAGRPSPYRARTVAENLDLFARMRAGEFADGTHVLRAKIDMAAANMKMRDPLLYRIRHQHHFRTGDDWCIYPMYDFAHPLSDAIEGVTHSICTLEFENNREIYDWLLEKTQTPPRPHQYEFARLNLDYTVMSKRKLLQLVREGHVQGWDDPRMPTLAGMRRRGVTPESIRTLCERVGVAKTNSRVELSLFEHILRDDLNFRAPRLMCVLRPLKVVLTNYPVGETENLEGDLWPRDLAHVKDGETRTIPFGRELYIEQSDFMEEPPADFYRLALGREVRLRHGYVIRCDAVVKDPQTGAVVELHCTYDAETGRGGSQNRRRVRGTIHWVPAAASIPVEVRLYDRLFVAPNPDDVEEGKTFLDGLNPDSLVVLSQARLEPAAREFPADTRFQFERQGYFWADPVDSQPETRVYNRIIDLRDSWGKAQDSKAQSENGSRPQAQKPSQKPAAQDQNPQAAADDSSGDRRSKLDVREDARAADPQLAQKYTYYIETLGLAPEDADVLTGDIGLAEYFEAALATHNAPQSVANWVTNEVLREIKGGTVADGAWSPVYLGKLVALVDEGVITANLGKDLLQELWTSDEDPVAVVEVRGLRQIQDAGALEPVVAAVLAENPDKVAAYQGGRTGLLGFFVGQVMRKTNGQANAPMVQELVKSQLER
ncbi:MAG: glutamine--tRNA ligase/YqeY domain fusion protein, partial [Litorilinea sp.]